VAATGKRLKQTKHVKIATCNSFVGVGEPSLCCDLSQVCGGARFGGRVHANVANGPRIGISAVISARVRSLRDGDSGSVPDPEDSQIWSAIDSCVDDCCTSQPHFRVGIWFVRCRCSRGDAAGSYCLSCSTAVDNCSTCAIPFAVTSRRCSSLW
jgi:hypothetical protein